MTEIDPRRPAEALVIENEVITAPIPRAATRALEAVQMNHQPELIEALSPFGLHPYDLLPPVYRRIVRPGERTPDGEPQTDTTQELMSRADAISNIQGVWAQCDNEFCVGQAELDASRAELAECLRALGCTEKEINS